VHVHVHVVSKIVQVLLYKNISKTMTNKLTNKNWFLQNAFTWCSKICCDLQEQEAKEDDIVDINQTSAEELDDDSSDDDF